MVDNYYKRSGLTTADQLAAMHAELAAAQTEEYRQKEHGKGKAQIVKNIIFFAVLAFLVILFAQVMVEKNAGETPHLFGFYLYTVETGSMDPTYPIGSIIVGHQVSEEEAANLAVGDVVTFFNAEDKKVTHRIVEISTDASGNLFYRTKGDYEGNSVDQDPLYPTNIQAKILFKLPFP